MTKHLSFHQLRQANLARLPLFRNAKGEAYHAPDGSDWSDAEWMQAVMGELGELANVCKKVRRGDMTAEEAAPLIRREMADVLCYLDLLAMRKGVDLGEAVVEKFNEVSCRVQARVFIDKEGEVTNEIPKHLDIEWLRCTPRKDGDTL